MNVTPYIEILEDPRKSWTLHEVMSPELSRRFKPHYALTLTQGLSRSGFWLRFRLRRPHAERGEAARDQGWMLDINTPWLIDVALYQARHQEGTPALNADAASRIATVREPFARTFVVSLPPDFDEDEPFYLYVESIGPLNMPVYLWRTNAFQRHNALDFLGFGVGYGVLCSMIAFNLFAFGVLRDRTHLYYSLQISAVLLYQFCTFGHAAMFFPWRIRLWAMLLYCFFGLATFWAVIFNMTFLATAIHAPRLHRIMQVYLGLSVIAVGLGIAQQFYPAQMVSSIMGAFFPLASLAIGIYSLRQGFHPARYFLLAWGSMLIGVFLWSLRALSILPHLYLLTYVFFGCSVFEAIFLSFALADRIKILQTEKELLRLSEHHYQNLSVTDELTTLYNKRYFLSVLHQEINKARAQNLPLTLIMADVDHFKQFNDTYGHVEGDAVLSTLGRLMRTCLRECDHGCRYGGEEFAIILTNTPVQNGAIVAERIRQQFNAHAFIVAGASIRLTVSLGVSELRSSDDFQSFVKQADFALYQAKSSGRNRVGIADADGV